jgi:8-oxo-dGTP pyrophosphatase MutT (NUDIX family)
VYQTAAREANEEVGLTPADLASLVPHEGTVRAEGTSSRFGSWN